MYKAPDSTRTFVIFGNLRLIEWITLIDAPLKPNWESLKTQKTIMHEKVTLHYSVKPYCPPDPYNGGETGGEIIDLIYPTGKIQLDFSEIAWTSPELCLKHWSCPDLFTQWQQSISTFLEKK
mgnify:CR=1 FL=1